MEKDKKLKYYDKNESQSIVNLINAHKYQQAMDAYREYTKFYPNDLNAVSRFINILICYGYFEEAEELLNNYVAPKKASELDRKLYIYDQIKLLGYQEKWEECAILVKENYLLLQNFRQDFYFMITFLEKKLNISFQHKIFPISYLSSQVLNYDENRALQHINRHRQQGEDCIFAEDFPLSEYYFYFRSLLPKKDYPQLCKGIFSNFYVFKYNHCGYINQKEANYVMVVTLANSNDIITMYPIRNIEKYPYIEIIQQEEMDDEKPKVKRLSQIEKFNQRYGKVLDKN